MRSVKEKIIRSVTIGHSPLYELRNVSSETENTIRTLSNNQQFNDLLNFYYVKIQLTKNGGSAKI